MINYIELITWNKVKSSKIFILIPNCEFDTIYSNWLRLTISILAKKGIRLIPNSDCGVQFFFFKFDTESKGLRFFFNVDSWLALKAIFSTLSHDSYPTLHPRLEV